MASNVDEAVFIHVAQELNDFAGRGAAQCSTDNITIRPKSAIPAYWRRDSKEIDNAGAASSCSARQAHAVDDKDPGTDIGPRSKDRLSVYTWFCVLLSTVSTMLMGYDIGIMSGALLFVRESLRLNEVQVEVVVGSLNLIAAVGSLAAGHVAGWLGRRRALLMSSALFILGNVILAASPNFVCLLAGRVVTGLGVGFAMMIAPLYSAEISPARVRGLLVSWTEVFVNVGILLGYVFGFAFEFASPRYNWRLMLGAGALPALFLGAAVLLKLLPESPRWLVLKGREEEAREVLRGVVCGGDEEEAQERLNEIRLANKEELELEQLSATAADGAAGRCSRLRRLLSSPLARMYLVAVGVNFFQQASGIDALVYYSPVVFGLAGIESKAGKLGATVGMGVTKLAFVLVATSLLDRVGRKKLLYWSAGGVATCLTSVATTFVLMGLNSAKGDSMLSLAVRARAPHHSPVGIAITILAVFAYVAFFSIGFGPISYVLTSEVFPLRHRSTAVGLSVFVNRAVSGSVALLFLSIAKAITPAGIFLLFTALTLLSMVFVWLMVPETKGKSLEEIGHLFDNIAVTNVHSPTAPRPSTTASTAANTADDCPLHADHHINILQPKIWVNAEDHNCTV